MSDLVTVLKIAIYLFFTFHNAQSFNQTHRVTRTLPGASGDLLLQTHTDPGSLRTASPAPHTVALDKTTKRNSKLRT